MGVIFAPGPSRNRPPLECGSSVTARPPKPVAALRVLSEVVRADPVPIRRDVAGLRQATAAEIQEYLTFAGYHDPMMSKIAVERRLEQVQSCGMG
jgi:hypothetical protein